MTTHKKLVAPSERGPLGQHLWDLRHAAQLSLREVEEASGVSNAYLSQLETGKITKPSPDILRRLADTYKGKITRKSGVTGSFEHLMELAGYVASVEQPSTRKSRLPALATEALTNEEEEELLKYLAFIRMRKGKT